MSDADSAKPNFESSVKLCAAVKKHKCLHDQNSHTKNAHPSCEAAWQIVARECNESIEYCKNRWKALRRSFFDGLKRKGNKYYLHHHLEFLLGKKPKHSPVAIDNDETNSSLSDALQKSDYDSHKLKKEHKAKKTLEDDDDGDDDDVKSHSSQTTSADESYENLNQSSDVFIINELDDETYQPDTEFIEDRRTSFNRTCKRPLNPHLINEIADEESQPKRPRRSDKLYSKSYSMDKIKTNTESSELVKNKSMNNVGSIEKKLGNDIGIQCGVSCTDFDEIFMQSIKNQLQEMNGRQKLNFKRKIYQSLLEVFDDAKDFPNINDPLPSPSKQSAIVVNTTVGELRLMRELVSLVHAAKNTPEIMNAKEKIKTNAETRSKSTKSPLAMSPTPDDDDLPFLITDSDAEEEIPLPRSWEEIKAKTAETSKTTPQENSACFPRRLLQKVVRVSGSNGGTIVAHDGDKKRIYRIIPKQMHPSGSTATPQKNESTVTKLLTSATKPLQDPRKDNVGTFYLQNTKTTQEVPKISSPNITIRPFTTKPINSLQPATASPATSNQQTSSNTNGQTIFKNIHPANRILSSSTGYFKMVPPTKTIVPSPNQKPSSQPTAQGTTTNLNVSKVMTAKFPISSMMPPNSNIATKRVHTVRAPAPLMQRRFSICGSLPAEKQNTATLANSGKIAAFTNNGKAPAQHGVSQIQISQPVSLNAKAMSYPTVPSTQTSNSSPKTTAQHTVKSEEPPAPKDTKCLPEKSKESVGGQKLIISAKGPVQETIVSQREIPILETAGTVEADDLDPLFVKAPRVKLEPLDDD